MPIKRGDKVIVRRIPESVLNMPSDLRDGPEGTLRVFQKLVNHPKKRTVAKVDDYGHVWIETVLVSKDGERTYHSVSLDEGCFDVVDAISKSKPPPPPASDPPTTPARS